MNERRLTPFILTALLLLAACNPGATEVSQVSATATLQVVVSLTPRFTATPVATRTPIPTFTPTPSDTPIPPTPSDTPTPTEVPPIIGIIASLQSVNVRNGPGVSYSAIVALNPGTAVVVLGRSSDGNWYNIEMEDGSQGWIASSLLFIEPTPTPIPTATPSPDLTALFLGTPLPTAILGGGTITPTPPFFVISPTPVGTPGTATLVSTDTSFLPIIDVTSINETATALAGGVSVETPSRTATGPTRTPGGPTATLQPVGSGSVQQAVDVLAYCNDRSFGRPAPTNLAAGSTIDVFWSWFASQPDLIQQHLDRVNYEVRVDGNLLQNWRQYRSSIRQQADGNYYVYWFVPYGPLNAGVHEISYRVTWDEAISDGYDSYGPGTNNPFQTGNCTFTVQ